MAMSPVCRSGVLAAMAPGAWSQVTVASQPLSVPVTIAEDEVLRSLTVRLQDFLAGQVGKLPHVSLLDRQNIAKLLQEQHFVAPNRMGPVGAGHIGGNLRGDGLSLGAVSRFANGRNVAQVARGKDLNTHAQ